MMVRIQLTFSTALLLLYITFSSSAFLATSISDAVSSKLNSSTADDKYALLSFKHSLNLDPKHVLATSWSESTHFCTWIGISCRNNTKNQRVSALHLPSMGLQGTIPPQIGNLSFLSYLNLMNNSFHGPLQPRLANLTHVTYINLGANNFDEEIPSWLGYFPNLEHLHLHSSFFSGTIPQSLTNISTLKTLSLFNNNLSGNIPEDIGKLSNLETLNLYDNRQISGSIASSLFNASFLKVLRVSNNKFSGSLPDDMCHHVPNLERLIIDQNQLDGQLPSSLSKCKHLVTISVGFNKFHGTIPPNLGNLTLLQDLDLTKNQIKGEIPEEMGFLHALKRFRAYDNHLQGSIPRSLFNCSLLWELDLVLNNFTVLEYMPNGSLEKWLYSHNYCLDMLQRLNIMIDVASGLDYLHHGFGKPMVHCDLKPSNVLLDADMVAHVGDFGISKLLGAEDSMTQTMTLATIGYMAPEYGSEGKVSTRGDVYSYGIMLMETFTRKKPTDDMFVGGMSLRQYVKGGLPGAIAVVADANLLAGKEHLLVKTDCLSSILSLAVDCSNESFHMRIDITEVLARLENIKTRFLRSVVSNESLLKNYDANFAASPSSPTSPHLRSNHK